MPKKATKKRRAKAAHDEHSLLYILLVALVIVVVFTSTYSPVSRYLNTDQAQLLFVQAAASGTIQAFPDQSGTYTLTLKDVNPTVTYFSDRPERIAGTFSTQDLFDFAFDVSQPAPNAALVVKAVDQNQRFTVALELTSPLYDEKVKTATYIVRTLDQTPSGLTQFGASNASDVPATFEEVELFIDSAQELSQACEVTINTDVEMFLDTADPPATDKHYSQLPSVLSADSENNLILQYAGNSSQLATVTYSSATAPQVKARMHVHCNPDGYKGKFSTCSFQVGETSYVCEREKGYIDTTKAGQFNIFAEQYFPL